MHCHVLKHMAVNLEILRQTRNDGKLPLQKKNTSRITLWFHAIGACLFRDRFSDNDLAEDASQRTELYLAK